MPASVPIHDLRRFAEVESCLRPTVAGAGMSLTSSPSMAYGHTMAYGHNVSEQVFRSFGCAQAIPAHLASLLRSSKVAADPLMGFEQRDRDRGPQTYPARVAAQGRDE